MANANVYLIRNKDGEYRSRGKNVHYTPDLRKARLYISHNQADSIIDVESRANENLVNTDYVVEATLTEGNLCINKDEALLLYPILTTEYTRVLKDRYLEKEVNGSSSIRYEELGNQLQAMAELKDKLAEYIENEDN